MKSHRYANLFPMCTEVEIQELAADIAKNGLRQPIVIDSDELILDGRHRAAACKIAGVAPTYEPFVGSDEEKMNYVVSVNLHRRHLKTSQRAMVAAKLLPLYEEQASERKKATQPKKGRNVNNQVPVNLPEPAKGDARDKAGAALNVSGKAVDMAASVQAKAIPEIADAVASGHLAVSAAAIVADLPVNKQRDIVASGGVKGVKAAASDVRTANRKSRRKTSSVDDNSSDSDDEPDDSSNATWMLRDDVDIYLDLLQAIKEHLIEMSPENRVEFWRKVVDQVDPEEIVKW